MYYRIENDSRKFSNIKYARKAAIAEFGYYDGLGIKNPIIRIYDGNMVGERVIGQVVKGPGYPIYIANDGTTYRLSRSGDARQIKRTPAPFGL